MADKQKVLNARKSVEAYRDSHTKVHKDKPWHKEVPKEHTPLLEKLLRDIEKDGFNSLKEFWTASNELHDGWQ